MSANQSIHVVAFDVPFPPDYGGVIDVYYRCRSLKNAGYYVILHAFEYGRGRQHDYSAIADEVFYYSRSKRIWNWFSKLPFIVRTRNSSALLSNLRKDTHPIIFEGQHCTFWLNHGDFRNRKTMVRLHNIEWKYYAGLAKRVDSVYKRWYFRSESRKLLLQEPQLKGASVLATISESDFDYYRTLFEHTVYVPVGFEMNPSSQKPYLKEPFYLFQGNLSVAENQEAVRWLLGSLEQISLNTKLIIAGKNPSASLIEMCTNQANVELVINPSENEMQSLLQSAKAQLVIGFQHTGIKLKLLHALMSGKQCIVTPQMLEGAGLDHVCTVIHSPEELINVLTQEQEWNEEKSTNQLEEIRRIFSADQWLKTIKTYLFEEEIKSLK